MVHRILIAHEWRIPRLMVGLLILELPLTVLCLVLMGVADPNTYRTKLWADGGKAGLNSNPNIILYSYANYKPLEPPLVWSQYMTTFNTVISVLSLFVLLVKGAMYTMHFWFPLLSVVVHAVLVGLFATSLYNQTAGDYLDPNAVATRPWYLTHSCKTYASSGNLGFCYQARASVYVAGVMVLLFTTYLIHGIYSSIPTPAERAEREADYLADIEIKKLSTYIGNGNDFSGRDNEFEMDNKSVFLNLPKTPKTPGFGALNPMTPRTTAFTRLNGGKAPEPRVVAVGSSRARAQTPPPGPSATTRSPTSATTRSPTSRALPFREQFGSGDA